MKKSNFILLTDCGLTGVSHLGLWTPAQVVAEPDAGVDLVLPPLSHRAAVLLVGNWRNTSDTK